MADEGRMGGIDGRPPTTKTSRRGKRDSTSAGLSDARISMMSPSLKAKSGTEVNVR
jgi:hypothetical protein